MHMRQTTHLGRVSRSRCRGDGGSADGIGLALLGSEVAAADLDHVRNAQSGELLMWAQELCTEADQLELYREVTVSGRGLRFIGLAKQGNKLHRKIKFPNGDAIELFRNCARFITISGLQEGACEQLGQSAIISMPWRRGSMKIGSSPANSQFDFNNAGAPPRGEEYYQDLIANGPAPGDDRNRQISGGCLAPRRYGVDHPADRRRAGEHPTGIGLKYIKEIGC